MINLHFCRPAVLVIRCLLVVLVMAIYPSSALAAEADDPAQLGASVEKAWRLIGAIKHPLLAGLSSHQPVITHESDGSLKAEFELENDPFGVGKARFLKGVPAPDDPGKPYLYLRVSVFHHNLDASWTPTQTTRQLSFADHYYFLIVQIATSDRNLTPRLQTLIDNCFASWLPPQSQSGFQF